MKALTSILGVAALANVAAAHYSFPRFIVNGTTSADWIYTRMTNNHFTGDPVSDVNSIDLRCYTSQTNANATTATVTAGSTVGFISSSGNIGHPGPVLVYMAKAPSSVNGWDGSGAVWFKIYQLGPIFNADGTVTWPAFGLVNATFTIPKAVPNGEYLLRIEHLAVHGAQNIGGMQFYPTCAQIKITGGGSGSPSPKVAIPGVYKADDPGILWQPYWPPPTSYTMPGPAVWKG